MLLGADRVPNKVFRLKRSYQSMPPLLKKGQPKRGMTKGPRRFVDLNKLKIPEPDSSASSTVKVAEIYDDQDVFRLMNYIYSGNILLINCESMSSDESAIKRVWNSLKEAAGDVNGDLAALTKDFFILTPKGISRDRKRLRGSF